MKNPMPDSGKAVFLSYAHEDADVARRIAEALRGEGIDAWFDESALRGGEAWDARCARGFGFRVWSFGLKAEMEVAA